MESSQELVQPVIRITEARKPQAQNLRPRALRTNLKAKTAEHPTAGPVEQNKTAKPIKNLPVPKARAITKIGL